jgi:hypothetical protein
MDTAIEAAQDELTAMLDDGLSVDLLEEAPGRFRLTITADETACVECIVPDNVMQHIALDKLHRRDVAAESVTIVRG